MDDNVDSGGIPDEGEDSIEKEEKPDIDSDENYSTPASSTASIIGDGDNVYAGNDAK